MDPEASTAAGTVSRPTSTSTPHTSWMTPAYHPGQVPTAAACPLPRLPPKTPNTVDAPCRANSSPITIRNSAQTATVKRFPRILVLLLVKLAIFTFVYVLVDIVIDVNRCASDSCPCWTGR